MYIFVQLYVWSVHSSARIIGGMKSVTPISCSLAELSPLERRRKINVREAAALNDLSEATFRRHYGHLIRKITPRRDAVDLCDAIDLPPRQAKT